MSTLSAHSIVDCVIVDGSAASQWQQLERRKPLCRRHRCSTDRRTLSGGTAYRVSLSSLEEDVTAHRRVKLVVGGRAVPKTCRRASRRCRLQVAVADQLLPSDTRRRKPRRLECRAVDHRCWTVIAAVQAVRSAACRVLSGNRPETSQISRRAV